MVNKYIVKEGAAIKRPGVKSRLDNLETRSTSCGHLPFTLPELMVHQTLRTAIPYTKTTTSSQCARIGISAVRRSLRPIVPRIKIPDREGTLCFWVENPAVRCSLRAVVPVTKISLTVQGLHVFGGGISGATFAENCCAHNAMTQSHKQKNPDKAEV